MVIVSPIIKDTNIFPIRPDNVLNNSRYLHKCE
jgi:hypothetical protein